MPRQPLIFRAVDMEELTECASPNGALGNARLRWRCVSEAPWLDCVASQHLSRLAGRLEDRHQTNAAPDDGAAMAEVVMTTITYPPKDLVRAYLAQRLRERRPPPAPEEIRRRLGWVMLLPELKFATTSGRN